MLISIVSRAYNVQRDFWEIIHKKEPETVIIFHHVQANPELKILGEILVGQMGGSIIFHHVKAKSELKILGEILVDQLGGFIPQFLMLNSEM